MIEKIIEFFFMSLPLLFVSIIMIKEVNYKTARRSGTIIATYVARQMLIGVALANYTLYLKGTFFEALLKQAPVMTGLFSTVALSWCFITLDKWIREAKVTELDRDEFYECFKQSKTLSTLAPVIIFFAFLLMSVILLI